MPRFVLSLGVLWVQRIAQWCAGRGHHEAAIGLFHNCLGTVQRMGDTRGEGIMHHNLGLVHQLKGDLRGAMLHYSRALTLEGSAGDPLHRCQTLIALGGCEQQIGDLEKARDYFHRAYLNAIQGEHLATQAACCNYLAEVAEEVGDTREAAEQWHRLHRIGIEAKQPCASAFASNRLARIHLDQAQIGDAWSRAEEARDLAEQAKDSYNLGLALATMGELAIREQAWSRALTLLTRAEKLLIKNGGDDHEQIVHRCLAQVHLALGNEAEATRQQELSTQGR